METLELLEIIARGEDGKCQFKADVTNETSLGQEMVAFSNAGGGDLFIGVGDDGVLVGLTRQDIGRLNQLVSNAASQQVRPPINPYTENITTADGLVMRVCVPNGVSKPYMDKNGAIWVKSGADKRKATSREEMQRLFQSAGLVHGDEVPASGLTVADLDVDYFKGFFDRNFAESLHENQDLSLPVLLENMNLMKDGAFNISGALLFAKNPNLRLPAFITKAIAFPGSEIHETDYLDSRDITGKIADSFHQSLGFVLGNIRHLQGDQGVNAPGRPEIPRVALEELIANALIHRDYFVSAPIKIFVFSDRVEIVSPGHLPNNLTVENIKLGNSNIRNPILASYATKILPYRGIGSGIIRALKAYADIDFEDDREGNRFVVTVRRVSTT
ncbi:MAG: putative DNA binding domain-containing protein [Gammaproteobacteria bacterium]|nr:putative DNA binding domain-containing protein [Gammaproteobacteria bacterium]NNJ84487.1 ATP-dependent DNA helicase RecG [Gammaproteobacteria bacterium]